MIYLVVLPWHSPRMAEENNEILSKNSQSPIHDYKLVITKDKLKSGLLVAMSTCLIWNPDNLEFMHMIVILLHGASLC
jgi:hypothetical protein